MTRKLFINGHLRLINGYLRSKPQITQIIIYPQINANYAQIILSDIYVIFTRIGGGKQPRIARIIIYPQINANYAQIIYYRLFTFHLWLFTFKTTDYADCTDFSTRITRKLLLSFIYVPFTVFYVLKPRIKRAYVFLSYHLFVFLSSNNMSFCLNHVLIHFITNHALIMSKWLKSTLYCSFFF